MGKLTDFDIQRLRWARDYWRNAYETLVSQTGRDLNDGLGLDPRKQRRAALKDQGSNQ